jgi:acyl-CoA thioesterase YciA
VSEPVFYEESDPSRWRLAIRIVAMPAHTNADGDIFGGWLMSQLDLAGATVAIQAANGRVTTVAVNELRFVAPVLVGDLVDIYARLHRTGNTSLTVELRAWSRREQDPGSRHEVAEALITYVAIGPNGRPRPVAGASAAGKTD